MNVQRRGNPSGPPSLVPTLGAVAHLIDSTVQEDGTLVPWDGGGNSAQVSPGGSRGSLTSPSTAARFEAGALRQDDLDAQPSGESPLTSRWLAFQWSPLVTWPGLRQCGRGHTGT